ncbi:2Fe-2S iron-sulfur cluster-binding protein [Marinobacterium lutimaris]|uniref:Ferredoxin, 2Fe-2S n=1 Tax=Marinobacterium lutimaris TaxID=568106 RepID=A0A1H6DU64_9GAMM|nr:2Fe-2S iron-sulfur cluster-binding protein [Marinobacterium lutimaris]SEG88236.1 ferredoxin, 2Fe-2S [Marinobacterium lutimaris]
MTIITFVQPSGSKATVEVTEGLSLMEAALHNGVEGILAECNGAAACATCHVVLPKEVYDRLDAPEDHEEDMLDFTTADRQPCSRLSCQVSISEDMNGMVVHIPGE